MTDHAVRVKSASGWVDLAYIATGPVGPQGPKGDPGSSNPSGPAGGDLTGAYPNPTIKPYRKGDTLDIQRTPLNGAETYRQIANGWNFYQGPSDPAIALVYTPPVNAWWEVRFHIGLLRKDSAEYSLGQPFLQLAPADVDGVTVSAYHYETQHSAVQTYTGRVCTRIFKLASGTAYACYAKFATDGGLWSFYQGNAYMFMESKAWAR